MIPVREFGVIQNSIAQTHNVMKWFDSKAKAEQFIQDKCPQGEYVIVKAVHSASKTTNVFTTTADFVPPAPEV